MGRIPRQRVLFAAAGAVVLVLVAVLAAAVASRTNPVDDAIEIVEDDAQFVRAADAGVAFLRISRVLTAGGDSCEGGETEPRCASYFQGAGYAQVAAVRVIRCTRPGIFEHRAAMREYLHELRDDPGARLPSVSSC